MTPIATTRAARLNPDTLPAAPPTAEPSVGVAEDVDLAVVVETLCVNVAEMVVALVVKAVVSTVKLPVGVLVVACKQYQYISGLRINQTSYRSRHTRHSQHARRRAPQNHHCARLGAIRGCGCARGGAGSTAVALRKTGNGGLVGGVAAALHGGLDGR